jgi:hypothetical protein
MWSIIKRSFLLEACKRHHYFFQELHKSYRNLSQMALQSSWYIDLCKSRDNYSWCYTNMFGPCLRCHLKISAFDLVYNHSVMKTTTRTLWKECVISLSVGTHTMAYASILEGVFCVFSMSWWCSCINLLSDSYTRFPFCRYANEARIPWNAPLHHEAYDFLNNFLNHHFGDGQKWHFWSADQKNWPLVSFVLKVIDRLGKQKAKLSFFFNCKELKHDALFKCECGQGTMYCNSNVYINFVHYTF